MSSFVVLLGLIIVVASPAVRVVRAQVQDSGQPGGQGVAGGQCPLFVVFMAAADNCSTCACSVDARMTDCTRDACPEPRGNYTLNECVENSLYVGTDGCNTCQCNAWRSFSWCTRKICLQGTTSAVARPPSPSSPPPNRPLRPPFPLQRPPPRRPGAGIPDSAAAAPYGAVSHSSRWESWRTTSDGGAD